MSVEALLSTQVIDTTSIGRSVMTAADAAAIRTAITAQETLVSATNIKTINSTSLLGSGDITVSADLSGYVPYTGASGAVNLGSYGLTCGAIITRNGTTPTSIQITNTYTSSTSFETLQLKANAGTSYEIGSAIGSAGGTNRDINFGFWNSAGTFNSLGAVPGTSGNQAFFSNGVTQFGTGATANTTGDYFLIGTSGHSLNISNDQVAYALRNDGLMFLGGFVRSSPRSGYLYGAWSYGTNVAASNLVIAGGQGTGTGVGGSLIFQTAPAGASGSSNNSHVTRLTIDSTGTFTFAGALTLPYVAKTANYTLDATNHTVDCTSNTFTITLPTAVSIAGRIYNIKNSGSGVITINTTSSQTIDGGASGSITLNQYDSLTVQSDGANWIII